MISKIMLLILGMINEHPINAYELIKKIDDLNFRLWIDIADSTVYATIKKLEKFGFVVSKPIKESNMPEKKVYSITLTGCQELEKSIRKNILMFDFDTNIFSVAILFKDIFSVEEQKLLLEGRINNLNFVRTKINREYDSTNAISVNYNKNIDRMNKLIDAETEFANSLIISLTN